MTATTTIPARHADSAPRRPAASRLSLFGALLAMLFLFVPAHAAPPDEPHATLALSSDTIDLGDSFVYQITIDGVRSADPVALPASDAYQAEFIRGRDESSHTIYTINGRTTESNVLRYVMEWRVTPLKAGRFTIPGFDLKVGSRTLSIPSAEFRAGEPSQNPFFKLTLEPEKTDAYVGEPVHVRLVWAIGRSVTSAAFSGPDGGKDYDVIPIDPRPPKTRSNPLGNQYALVDFVGGKLILSRTQATLDARTVPAFVADLVITPRAAGSISVGPYRVAFDEVVGQRQRTFFDSPFDDLAQTRRSVVASNAVTLNVKPLPQEGRPADFSGLIGNFSLDAAVNNTEASVGDPIPLTLTIRGPEPLDDVAPPELDSQPDISSRFKAAPEGWEPAPGSGSTLGERTYTTTIRPKSDSVTQVPPIRLPYFDTSSGTYGVALSNPIPMSVHAAREVTLADAYRPGAPAISVPAGSPAQLTSGPAGIGANTESLDALVNQQVSVLAMLRSPGGVAFIVAPPAALALVGILAHRRRTRDPVRAARHEALARARRDAERASSHAELSLALRGAFAPFLDVAPRSVTSSDAASLPGQGARAAELLSDLEAASYDQRPVALDAAKARAMTILEGLAKP